MTEKQQALSILQYFGNADAADGCGKKESQTPRKRTEISRNKLAEYEEYLIVAPEVLKALSGRELQTVFLRMRGFSYREIGETLKISEATVNDLMKSIYKKLNVHEDNSFFYAIYGEVYPNELLELGKKFRLSDSNKELLGCILSGFSSADCATQLNLSINTVRSNINMIYSDMKVHDRAALFAKSHEFIAGLRSKELNQRQGALLDMAIQEQKDDQNWASLFEASYDMPG